MDALTRAGNYLQAENDTYDSVPESISIKDCTNTVGYKISGRFPEEQTDDEILAPKEQVLVTHASDMHSQITDIFETIYENVSIIGDARISSIHIRHTSDAEKLPDDWSFYTSETADARIFIGVVQEHVPTNIRDELLDLVIGDLQEVDSALTTENIKNVEFLFSDMNECLLQTVCGNVITPRPHNHFANVNSLDEYIDTIADSETEKTSLYDQDTYEIYYRLSDVDSLPNSNIRDTSETIMMDFIMDSFETDWEYIVESEGIYLGDSKYESLTESMRYYMNIPVVGNEIGVSR